MDARTKLGALAKNPDPFVRIENYKKVIKRVHPVMRYFFMESHYLPSRWFEMRLLYSRSTAVMSMIGYVLGLGDRHVSNIMIDTATGELIPIDFGITFEAVSRIVLLVRAILSTILGRESSCPHQKRYLSA